MNKKIAHQAVKTRVANAQALLEAVKTAGAITPRLKPYAKDGWFYVPVDGVLKTKIETAPCASVFEEKEEKNTESILQKKGVAQAEIDALPRSFDIIGDIALVEMPEGITKKTEGAFSRAIMAVHPRIKTVAMKSSATSGPYRIRNAKVVAGERRTQTIHVEEGCRFKVDINTAYFQPRLSFERKRITQLVKPRENVLALFAGVGPYAIIMAKKNPKGRVVAVEYNPAAAAFAKDNVAMNKSGNVEVFCEDAHKFLKRKEFFKWADRVVMPHPSGAMEFIEEALFACKDGATVHLYAFVENDGGEEKLVDEIKKACRRAGFACNKFSCRRVLSFSPHEHQACVDFRVSRARK